ncbi:MAG: hemolysin III family protein [Bacteroidaceae bacterium]|nr:hemolysin III family protein [Bacteroidaceae bacterium]
MRREELYNAFTHLAGFVFAAATSWYMVWLATRLSWEYVMGVSVFICGMAMMYASSTLYHLWVAPRVKRVLRLFDHISIYVMIAGSYTPLCIAVVGGWVGWLMFAVQWALVIGGTFYKIFAIGRWPALSLGIYLAMGWSVLLIARPVYESIDPLALGCIAAEGIIYTLGTYFYAHDSRPHYHAIWHVFVLLGSICHWLAVLFIMLKEGAML